jgi:hypothetical protein
MSVIIRKPTRLYPLPKKLRDLDEPNRGENLSRYVRVDRFQDGYNTSKNPLTVVKTRISTVLDRM